MAVDHKGLVAIELESVAGAHRLHFGLQRSMFCTFIDGERGEQRAVRNLRQMLRLLRLAAAARQARRPPARGGEERRRHQGAADFLHHDAGLDAAEPAAAEFLRHQQAGKSHLGKGLPELAGKSGGVLRIAQLTQMRHRRLVADKAARAIAQHGLFFGKDECHWRSSGLEQLRVKRFGFVIPGRVEDANHDVRCTSENSSMVPGSTLRAAPERRRMSSSPRQIEDAFGDDAEHHLAGAAFDRVGLGAQPGARAGAAFGSARFPIPARRCRPPTSGSRSGAC